MEWAYLLIGVGAAAALAWPSYRWLIAVVTILLLMVAYVIHRAPTSADAPAPPPAEMSKPNGPLFERRDVIRLSDTESIIVLEQNYGFVPGPKGLTKMDSLGGPCILYRDSKLGVVTVLQC